MSTEAPTKPVGILLSDDLMFSSRITGTARDLGLVVQSVSSVDALVSLAERENPTCVIIDLSNRSLAVDRLINNLRESCKPAPRVVAYGSHVDAKSLHAAREAGCDLVLPRSKFVEELPRSLAQWMKPDRD
jgi:CheY-like chemotaxis protein